MGYEQIWAPWRLGYILSEKPAEPPPAQDLLPGGSPDCFLCRGAAPGDDRQGGVVWRGERVVVVLNRYPYNNGHLLVAPKRHCGKLDQLTPDEHAEVATTLAEMVKLLENSIKPEGFNVGLNLGRAAGAGLPEHLHWHIVPRWAGDTNFMPVAAGIRVIPQSLDALWELLRERLSG
ncbi:MAG: HIT family protein [Planctomycetota bacterium]